MTTTGAVLPAESAVSAPTKKASAKLIAAMAMAQFGLSVALLTPVTASLTIKVQSVVGQDNVVAVFGIVSTIGALAAFLANPIFGRISDRTTSRFGRRRPWLLLGVVGLAVSEIVLVLMPDVLGIAIAWFAAQAFANAAQAALLATIADQIPPEQRGRVSGLIGLMQQGSKLGSAYIAQFLVGNLLLMFALPAFAGVLLLLPFLMMLPDRRLVQPPRAEGFREVLQTFWLSPRRHPDFALAWGSRFLLTTALYMFMTYRLLYMQHELKLSTADATAVLATGVLIYTVTLALAGQAAGWLSDRVGRRKLFVIGAAAIFGVGMWMLAQASSAGDFYLAELVLGLGFGIYIAVDLALVIDVLPGLNDSAKNLGVLNMAQVLPQSIAPGIGAVLIGVGGGHNYDLLLGTAAAVSVAGALLILPIKKVR
ncbi:MFS transporter [Arthrobacter sp. FW306-2-2C-D06B]|uniref:MFS transporter n=1 Tax=Arthrobacter sp. FW306-2-2C-D06B TaxID=2879618 RepID=UPI001F0248C4|nr:MFS transporter [Arthrobacter sp. FW306-2-2C-D06B]UKA60535.1 MFS transporter [Arthrobacter sp. FW306-2-2C-D06B]